MFHQRNLHEEAGRHEHSQLISTLDEVTNFRSTTTDTEEADFVVADTEEEPSVLDAFKRKKLIRVAKVINGKTAVKAT